MRIWSQLTTMDCIELFIAGEFVQVNPYKGVPNWGEIAESSAHFLFLTVSQERYEVFFGDSAFFIC
jgi:hypothetical protein